MQIKQKIEIFKQFKQTGQKLAGNTVFNGYPIGVWAIQIRSYIKRGKNSGALRFSKDEIMDLEDLGILEKQRETIDEKIDKLIEWNKKYPKAQISGKGKYIKNILHEYAHTEEEYHELIKKFNKMLRYYEYINERYRVGKLTNRQFKKCKEGNVRGFFGYPEKTKKAAQEYKIDIEYADEILTKYKSVEDFLMENIEKVWRKTFEINLENDEVIDRILRRIYDDTDCGILYDYNAVMEQINKLPEKLIIALQGVGENSRNSTQEIVKKMEVSGTVITNYINRAIGILKKEKDKLNVVLIPNFNGLSENEKRKIIELLGNYVFNSDKAYESTSYNVTNLTELVEICKTISKYGALDLTQEQMEEIELRREIMQLQKQEIEYIIGSMPIENLNLTLRAYNALKRQGVSTIQEIIDLDKQKGLKNIRDIGEKVSSEILEKMRYIEKIKKINYLEKQMGQNDIKNYSDITEEENRILDEYKQKEQGELQDSSTPEGEETRIKNESKNTGLERLRYIRDELLARRRVAKMESEEQNLRVQPADMGK